MDEHRDSMISQTSDTASPQPGGKKSKKQHKKEKKMQREEEKRRKEEQRQEAKRREKEEREQQKQREKEERERHKLIAKQRKHFKVSSCEKKKRKGKLCVVTATVLVLMDVQYGTPGDAVSV